MWASHKQASEPKVHIEGSGWNLLYPEQSIKHTAGGYLDVVHLLSLALEKTVEID